MREGQWTGEEGVRKGEGRVDGQVREGQGEEGMREG